MTEPYRDTIADHVEVLRSIAGTADLLATYLRREGEEPCEALVASLISITLDERADAILAEWRRLTGAGRQAASR